MKKAACLVLFLTALDCVGLFARDLGFGWSLEEIYPGTYSLDDNDSGICYNVDISSDMYNFIVTIYDGAERFVKKVMESGIKQAVSSSLQYLGVAARRANIAADAIYQVFKSSPAY
jgi:hypothetical protein